MDFPQKSLKGLLKETGKLLNFASHQVWNPETDISEKRAWTSRNAANFSRHSTGASRDTYRSASASVAPGVSAEGVPGDVLTAPLPMFDYFCVVGLEDRPETVDAVWEKNEKMMEECTMHDVKVLYSYPLGGLPEDLQREIPTYCFPIGTGAYAVRRSAGCLDLTEITDVVYGQHYDMRSDASFVFQLQTTTADRPTPETLFGVCFYRKEFLHRRPKMFMEDIYGGKFAEGGKSGMHGGGQDIPERLVASGRCYCLLSRVPMFERHFELLRNILSFERHHQIEEYARQVDEGLWAIGGTQMNGGMSATADDHDLVAYQSAESVTTAQSARRSVTIMGEISSSDSDDEVDDPKPSVASTVSTITRKPHHERKLTSISDFHTPEDTPSAPLLLGDDDCDDGDDMTPFFTAGDRNDRNDRNDRQAGKTKNAKTKRTMSRLEYSRQRTHTASTEDDLEAVRKNLTMMRVLDDTEILGEQLNGGTRSDDPDAKNNADGPSPLDNGSTELGSWIEADTICSRQQSTLEDTAASKPAPSIAASATTTTTAISIPKHANDTSTSPIGQVWCNRHPLRLLEQYKALDYRKQVAAKEIPVPVTNLINSRGEPVSSMKCTFMSDMDFLAAKELEGWAICVLCRALSVENIVQYLTAVLLERQIVVFDSNIAYLSAIVLSLQPLLAPFTWQSLLLPIVPVDKQDLLQAPVPFVIGMLTKTRDIRAKCGGLVRVNAYKDDIKNAGYAHMPRLPNAKALIRSLEEPHARIRRYGVQYGADGCPIYEISPEERREAVIFAEKVRSHLMALTSELAFFWVTDVSGTGDGERVGILMRDAFVESFEGEDREFVNQWTQSQMFELYSDWIMHN